MRTLDSSSAPQTIPSDAARVSRTRATQGFALMALAAVVLAPPEAYGSGRMLLILGATAAFLIQLAEGRVPLRYLQAGLAGRAFLTAHALWLSLDVYRSLQFLPILWAYYCLFAVFAYSREPLERPLIVTLLLLAGAVSVYGVYQYFWGLGRMYDFVMYSGSNEVIRVPALQRLATERIFSTFALPGTLWGFLLTVLPLHAAAWAALVPRLSSTAWRRMARLALAAGAALGMTATVLTRSYGLVAGVFGILLTMFWMRSRRTAWKPALLIALPLAAAAGAIGLVRSETHDPVSLRVLNWLSAWEIFAAHPLGAGIDAYAILYPQHRQIGANETQYAHNTPLQLLAEMGIFAVAAAALLAFWIWRRQDRSGTAAWDFSCTRPYLGMALAAWTVHNLIDINVYFASVGAIGCALAGVMLGPLVGPADPEAGSGGSRRWTTGAVGCAAAAAVVASGFIYISGELLHRARIELGDLENEAAAATLTEAAAINPFDSSIFHESGQVHLELYHKIHDPALLDRAVADFSRAIELSPLKVGPYVGLALCLSTRDRTEEALRQLEIAQYLHPEERQPSVIRRLIERRHAELAAAKQPGGLSEPR